METGTEIRKAPAMEFHVDLKYEFCAPHFFDFCVGETQEEADAAERWFTGAVGHPPSPLVGKVKSVQELSTGCSLEEYIGVQKLVARVTPEVSKMMEIDICRVNMETAETKAVEMLHKEINLPCKEVGAIFGVSNEASKEEPCTPREQFPQRFVELQSTKAPTNKGRKIPSKWNHSELHKQAVLKNFQNLAPSRVPATKRCLNGPQNVGLGDEHAAKKQKLEGGRSIQVLDTKTPQAAPPLTISQQFRLNAEKHAWKRQKLEGGQYGQLMHTKTLRAAPSLTVPHEFHFQTEKRAHIHKESGQCISESQAQSSSLPYISIAEMVQRFQMNLLGEFNPQDKAASSQRKRGLRLTHPKEPMLGTTMRARPPTVKSFAEQEEEMLANLPKFKARPLNKRILQGPTLPPPSRSTPQLPEFQEFNLKTMERALMHQHAAASMTASSGINSGDRLCLTRGELDHERPPRIKSTRELEQELAMLPKFKARPLDKRIFSSRGDVGVYTVPKRQATIPKEFQFATDQRAQHHDAIMIGQQNQGLRLSQHSKFERTLYAKGTAHNTFLVMDADENQSLQQNTKMYAFGSRQQMPGEASIGPERVRKPLGEIQQQFVFAQSAQQPKVQKHDNGPVSWSHARGGLQTQQADKFSVQLRSVKDLPHAMPERTPARQAPNTAFPMYFMR